MEREELTKKREERLEKINAKIKDCKAEIKKLNLAITGSIIKDLGYTAFAVIAGVGFSKIIQQAGDDDILKIISAGVGLTIGGLGFIKSLKEIASDELEESLKQKRNLSSKK